MNHQKTKTKNNLFKVKRYGFINVFCIFLLALQVTPVKAVQKTASQQKPEFMSKKDFGNLEYALKRLKKSQKEDVDYPSGLEANLRRFERSHSELKEKYEGQSFGEIDEVAKKTSQAVRNLLLELMDEKQKEREPTLIKKNHFQPVFGAPKIGDLKPGSCDVSFKITEFPNSYDKIDKQPTADINLNQIAAWSCRAPNLKSRYKWVGHWWQGVANETGLDAKAFHKHNRALLRLGQNSFYKEVAEFCETFKNQLRGKSRSKMTVGELGNIAAQAIISGCVERAPKNYPGNITSFLEAALASPLKDVQLIRGALLYRRLNVLSASDLHNEEQREKVASSAVTHFAALAADVNLFDLESFRIKSKKELPQSNNASVREYWDWRTDFVGGMAKTQSKALHEIYSELNTKVSGIEKVAFEVPLKAFKDWNTYFSKDKKTKKLIENIREARITGNIKKVKGCFKTTHKLFQKRLNRAKNEEDVAKQLSDPITRTLYSVAKTCANFEKRELENGYYRRLGFGSANIFGPRAASVLAAKNQVTSYLKKNPDYPLQAGYFAIPHVENNVEDMYMYTSSTSGGAIQSIRKSKDGLKLTFKKVRWESPNLSCVETNKIERIMSDGTIRYRRNCRVTGVSVDWISPSPVVVPKYFANGLKKGRFINFTYYSDSNRAYINDVFRTKKMKKKLFYMNMKLK